MISSWILLSLKSRIIKKKNKPIFVDNSQEEVVSKPISYYYFDLEEPEMAQQAVREKKYLGLDIEPEI